MSNRSWAAAFTLILAGPAPAMAAPVLHLFRTVAISPDGRHVAAIEQDDLPSDTAPPLSLVIHDLSGGAVAVTLPCQAGPDCKVSAPSWSPDGSRLSFLIQHDQAVTAEIDQVAATGGPARRLLSFDGPLEALRTGPDGRLAVLATQAAHKRVGRTEAAAALTGVVGTSTDEQRIAIVEGAALRFVSPADLYVYEFDWRPDGGFVGTAAHGDGDSNWWIARLYAFGADGSQTLLFAPGPARAAGKPGGVTGWCRGRLHRRLDERRGLHRRRRLPAAAAPAGRPADRPHAGLARHRHRDRLALRRRADRRRARRRPRLGGAAGPAGAAALVRRPVAVVGRLEPVAVLQPSRGGVGVGELHRGAGDSSPARSAPGTRSPTPTPASPRRSPPAR